MTVPIFVATGCNSRPYVTLRWQRLPAIPDAEGFAAPFAGTSGGALIVAGGANFPDLRPWEGGRKTWYDLVFVLEKPDGPWKTAKRLPRPIAYGVSVTTPDGIVCIGGGDAQQHFRDVFRLHWEHGQLTTVPMPSLPKPCAFACGALVNDTIYVAGGIENPDAGTCLKTFWALDLRRGLAARWQELEPCPGPERMLAVAGAAQCSFFLFSGARLVPGQDGKPAREYLRDAWRYVPGQGWKRLADLPRPAVAAPSPAPSIDGARLLIISGDDGTKISFKPPEQHPGFPRDVLSYDIHRDVWTDVGEAPISRATVPVAVWNSRFVIPTGEARPGYRSPDVWTFSPKSPR